MPGVLILKKIIKVVRRTPLGEIRKKILREGKVQLSLNLSLSKENKIITSISTFSTVFRYIGYLLLAVPALQYNFLKLGGKLYTNFLYELKIINTSYTHVFTDIWYFNSFGIHSTVNIFFCNNSGIRVHSMSN